MPLASPHHGLLEPTVTQIVSAGASQVVIVVFVIVCSVKRNSNLKLESHHMSDDVSIQVRIQA